jgi:hypothetical protein
LIVQRRRAGLIAILVLVLGGGLAVAFRAPLLRATVAAALDMTTGYRVAFTSLALGRDGAVAEGVSVRRGPDPVLEARRVTLHYTLRDLFPGASRRYGLRDVLIEGANFSIVRHADGTFNIAAASGQASGKAPEQPAVPLRFHARIVDASVTVIDPYRIFAGSRRIVLQKLSLQAEVDTAGRTHYVGSGGIVTAGAPNVVEPLKLAGSTDAQRGYGVHRLTAAHLRLRDLVNYIMNSPTAHASTGDLRDVDLRAYAFDLADLQPKGYHLSGGASLEDGILYVPGLKRPLRDLRGRLNVYDDGLAVPNAAATLGGIPVRLAGAIYGWSAPAFRLGAVARGDLTAARTLFAFSQRLPLNGGLNTDTLIEGPVGLPLVATSFSAPSADYGAYPLRNVHGAALYYDSSVTLVPVAAKYGPIDFLVTGRLDLGQSADSRLLVDAHAPAGSIPYLAQAVPGAPLRATALMLGSDLAFDTRGVLDGAGGGDQIAGSFHVDGHGDGTFGPFGITHADGSSAVGAFYLNRSVSLSGFWLDAQNFRVAASPRHPVLPGLPNLAPPELSGTLDGTLAGEGSPSTFSLAGRMHARNVIFGAYTIADVDVSLAGSPGDVRLNNVRAQGPWGRFEGAGGYASGGLALLGTYHGSFEELRTFSGDLGATGAVDGPVALLIDSNRTLVQTQGASSPGARVHGIPFDGLNATLAISGGRLDIYAASANLAGGRLAAAGTLGGNERLGVSVSGANALELRGAGSPLDRGSVAAIGSVAYEGALPTFDGGISVDGGSVRRLGVAGNGEVRANASDVSLRDTSAQVGQAYGLLGGTLGGVGTRSQHYALTVQARDVPVGPFARLLNPHRHDIGGMLDSTLSVAGSGSSLPMVSGDIAMTEGTFNGQAFRDVRARIGVGPTGLAAEGGSVVVGSTHATFSAMLSGSDATLRLNAPDAELSDFDDLFDTGDTLGGRGRIAGDFSKRGATVQTDADVAITRLRYRLFELGDATALWTSKGQRVNAHVAIGGASGRLEATGALTLASRAPVQKLLQRSSFDGTAQLRGLDLGVWLPVLGYQVPVGGRVDADATLSGPLSNPNMTTEATLLGGTIWKFPVDRAVLSLDSNFSRATLRSAELDLPALVLTANGSLDFGKLEQMQLAVHANSSNLGTLVKKFYGTQLSLTGTAEADLHADGPRSKPHIVGGFDIEKATVGGVAIPRALGEFTLAGRDFVLSDAEVGFNKGTLFLAGSVPFQVAPFGLGPASAPLSLELSAKAIDLTNFAPLLPANSTLKGLLDGRIALNGTAGNPQLIGGLALTGGEMQSPYETVPLTKLGAQLTFTSKTLTLESLHAEAGGGSLDLNGNATFPDLVKPGADATYAFSATAKALRLNFPRFGQGQIDGTFALTHEPGKLALISGTGTLQDAVIPFSALLLPSAGALSGSAIDAIVTPTLPLPADVAFALNLTAGNNVRVRSGNVDIGGRGPLQIAGTASSPQLTGRFDSTGGTLAYFNTVFRVQSGAVTFEPGQGLIPSLDAIATTHVINPDPNSFKNPTGTADITLGVTGLVTNMNIQLSSDPSYDRQQILGLLLNAPAIGASLFATSPGVPVNRNNGQVTVGQEAFGILNAQFTRNLLAPIETQAAGALGLTNLAFNVDYGGGLGLSARKVLGKTTDLIYVQSFTYPYRQTFGFDLKPNPVTAMQFTIFQSLGAQGFGVYTLNNLNPSQPYNQRATATQPSTGTSGFSFSLQRLFN